MNGSLVKDLLLSIRADSPNYIHISKVAVIIPLTAPSCILNIENTYKNKIWNNE